MGTMRLLRLEWIYASLLAARARGQQSAVQAVACRGERTQPTSKVPSQMFLSDRWLHDDLEKMEVRTSVVELQLFLMAVLRQRMAGRYPFFTQC